MASCTGFFLLALICTARSNPLGPACDTLLPNILPNVGTTVCESTPNVYPNLGLGLSPLGLNLQSPLGLQLLQQSVVPSLGSTTVCESKPNIGLPVLSPYGLPLNAGKLNAGVGLPSQTTVCESTNNLPAMNLPYGLNYPGGLLTGLNYPGGLVNGLNYPGALLNGLNYPGGLVNGPGSTTVCESTSNPISSLNLPVGVSGLGLPYSRQLGGYGLPLSGLGLPLNGLGLPLGGLGLPLNGLSGLAVSPLGLPLL